jgi:hypothetical protein
MPKKTYTHINSITLAAASSLITFSSVPQNFRDLVLVSNGSASTDTGLFIYFNNDNNAANYSRILMGGDGSTVSTTTASAETGMVLHTGQSSNISSFMDYSTNDKFKVAITRQNRPQFTVQAHIRSWNNTNAISSISISANAGTMNIGTSFTLYGIEA